MSDRPAAKEYVLTLSCPDRHGILHGVSSFLVVTGCNPAIVSNHPDFATLAEWHGIPYHHLPVSPDTKADQEARLRELVEQHQIDLVVLARYMQVLSDEFCKLIGATAHYVTAELDEGPIIEQEVARVDHALTTEQLAAVGRDVECQVLARAVQWHVEHRVLLNGRRTVVFH